MKRSALRSRLPVPDRFPAIYADPAWQFSNRGSRASPDYNLRTGTGRRGDAGYRTLDLDGVCALRVEDLAEPDALLALWCPWTMLLDSKGSIPPALRVVEAWGFRAVQGVPWIKGRVDDDRLVRHVGMGNYVRVCTEVLLICVRGKLSQRIETENRLPGLLPVSDDGLGILAPRGRHSAKPEIGRELVERLLPGGPYVELFARETVSGWYAWGDEVPRSELVDRL